jgi:hypothetical protein
MINNWVAQYLKNAKVALRGKPQLLEKIGVTARTSKTAAQRAALAKAAATRAAKKVRKGKTSGGDARSPRSFYFGA